MKSLIVDLAERSYPIYIGSNLLSDWRLLQHLPLAKQVLIVTNSTVAPMYLDTVIAGLGLVGADIDIRSIVLPDGEKYKNSLTLEKIYEALIVGRFERSSMLVALGGGVVGDLTGYAAATYQRGVSFLQVPTTLLSQVDSSVGGKTGINHPLGKNMIGAFHQPRGVIIDTNTLKSLPHREISAGLAEVIKYGLLCDSGFFDWLELNISRLLDGDTDAMSYAIERSCTIKSEVVASDERESGKRALLNLGHTFGHAIEAHQGYGHWLHGEAVGLGMMIAAQLSERLGWLRTDQVIRIRSLLENAKLPVRIPSNMRSEDFFEKMQIDKKVQDGKIRYILLESIGAAVIVDSVNISTVTEAINLCRL